MDDHKIRVFDTGGKLQKELTDFESLAVTEVVDAPGLLTLGLSGTHSLMSIIQDLWQVEYWRRPLGSTWRRQFTSIYRDDHWEYEETPTVKLICPGLMSMLGWRYVNWPEFAVNRTVFGSASVGIAAETVMKTLVNYNAGTLATTLGGRKSNGAISGLTVEADSARGNLIGLECAGAHLLTTLQKIAPLAGGDYDLVKTAATAYQFRFYPTRLGTDRTSTIKFSMALGNMVKPVYDRKRSELRNAAAVYGKGEGPTQLYINRTGPSYTYPGYVFETLVQASNADENTQLQDAGDAALAATLKTDNFSFEAVQTPSTIYGVHYFLGDQVTAINPFTGVIGWYKVKQVTHTIEETGNYTITVLFEFVSLPS